MQQITTITINHIRYPLAELQQLCKEKQSGETAQWEKDIFAFISIWLDENETLQVYTSGSTGKPKKIKLRKSWMKYSAGQTCNFFGLNQNSSALLCLPASYIAGKMMIVRAFVSGLNLITCPPEGNPFHHLTEIVDFAAVTPFQLHQSLATLANSPAVKTLIVGGGEISPALSTQARQLDINIYATYGMTETSSHIALKRVNGQNPERFFRVIGDTQIKRDERNCLTICNPHLFEGWLVTNDIVSIEDDRHFRWLGRYDNIINSGGLKISPEEIEQVISHLREDKMIVTSKPHPKLGQALVLVLENRALTHQEKGLLEKEMKNILPVYHLPKEILALEHFPLTATGKPDRMKIASLVAKKNAES
ncbi:MAG: long-chain fatty acid--CoA ligase [Bacteroidetes bacterium]|nr:MAG: long-chain fatty acid--CoA ligase [Bacteroidota bacterium]